MLGLARTTASVATLLWAAEPALIMFGAWVLLREKVTLRLLSGIAAAGFGVLLVSGAGTGITVMGESTYGSMLILGGVLCCALYTVISRKIVETIEPLSTVALQQTIGLIWAFSIWYLVQQQSVFQTLAALRSAELLGGAISGLMYYAAAFWLYLNALRSVPATTASIFLNLTPLFAVATAYVFFGERLSLVQWIGGGTILLSVLGLISCDVGEGGLLNLKFQRRRVSL